MKKVLLLLTLAVMLVFHGRAQLGVGQQMQNNGFENWTTDGGSSYNVPSNWHSICSATGSGANYAKDAGFVNSSSDVRPGSNGTKSVQLKAVKKTVFLISKLANGSFTTGRFNAIASIDVSVTGNCTYTSNESGYNQTLTAYPDSVYLWVKSQNASSSSLSHASIKVHGGGVANNNVIYQDPDPSGTGASQSAGGMTAAQNQAKQVAYAQLDFNTGGVWELKKIPFTYTNNGATPAYVLATFSTNVTPGGGAENDILKIDEVVLIYNTRLATLKVNGTDLAGFNPNVTEYNYPTPICGSTMPSVTGTCQSAHASTQLMHTPTQAEPYVILRVKHQGQETTVYKDYRINFTISTGPSITLNSPNNTYTGCTGDNITVTASGASSYSWSGGLGSGATVHPSVSGTYTVTGTDANGCTGTANAYVTINPLPSVTINGSANATAAVCSGASATLTAGGASTYAWSNGSNATSINAGTTGTYTVTGTLDGCTSTATATVSVHDAPTVAINGPASLCSGTEATLTATGASTYSWGGAGSGTSAALPITAGGTYTVTGTDIHGCTGTATHTVTGKTTPTVSISGTSALCDGATGTLTATVSPANATLTWTGGATGSSLSITSAGTYTVTATLDGCEATATANVSEAAAPAAPAVANGTNCGPGAVTLSVSNPDGSLTYHWFATEASQSELATGTSYSPTLTTSQTYYVSAKNAGGCYSARVPVTATILNPPAAPAVSNTSICGEGDITLTATSANTVKWYTDAEGNNETTANQYITATTTFHAAAIDGNGCRSSLVAMTVTVNPLPAAPTVTSPEPFCSNGSVNVVLTASPATGCIVRWYDADHNFIGIGQQNKTVSGSTLFYATSYSNATQCESSPVTFNVVVNPLPAAPTVSNTSICGEGDITLTATSANTVKWYVDANGNNETTANQHITSTITFHAAAIDGNGCRSAIVPMTVTMNPVYTGIADYKTACGSYTWQGETYTASGHYTKTLTSVNGCDSTVTLHLTINNGYNQHFDTTVCNQFVWQGETVTATRDITKQLTSSTGCDSTVTYHVTVKHSSASAQTLTLCSDQLPYPYAGISITSAGVKTITLTNAEGCDSVITLTVNVNPKPGVPTITSTTLSRCGAGPLSLSVAKGSNSDGCRWYDSETAAEPFQTGTTYQANLSESATYWVSSYSNAGCESDRIALAVTVNAVPADPQITTAEPARCGAGTIVLAASHDGNATTCRWYANANPNNTNVLSSEETYTVNFTGNQNTTRTFYVESYNESTGCKSASRVAATATENAVPAAPQVTAASNCGPLTANLADYVTSSANTLRWYDSEENLLNDGTAYNTTVNETVSYLVSQYNAETTCESPKATLNVTIFPTYDPRSLFDTVCQHAAYQKHGISQTFDETGTFDFVVNTQSANGCDSLVTLYIYVKPQITNTIFDEACDSYTWNNETYIQSGTYTQTFTAANGCDSMVTLNLAIHSSVTKNIEATECDRFVWNNETYTSTGTYTQTFTAANGCDSTVTLHLTIHSSVTKNVEAAACEEYVWNGKTYTESGVYTQQLTTVQGCDSTVTMTLTIHEPALVEFHETVCAGTAYTGHGFHELFEEPGEQTLTHQGVTVHGCDSTTVVYLTVLPTVMTELFETICHNGSYLFNGEELRTEGDYTAHLTAANGCDSTVILHLDILPPVTKDIEATACDRYEWNNTLYIESGDYVQTFTAANGCDSTVTLHLTINPSVTEIVEASACESCEWNGETYTESGEYEKHFTNRLGCDSTAILHLTIHHSNTAELTDETCLYARYTNFGFDTLFTTVGEHTLTSLSQNVYGCDSLTTLTLTVWPVFETDVYDTICFNGEYHFHGMTLTTTGIYEADLASVHGCDSIVYLHLYVHPEKRREISADICEGETYNAFGFVVAEATETQDLTHVEADANGCDSTTVLHLSVHQPAVTDLYATLCQGETFSQYGFLFNAATVGDTTLTRVLATTFGCDSTINLHITVNPTHHVMLNGQTCAGDRYTENGFDTLFTQAGTYTLYHNDLNTFGCDSVTELRLTVSPVYRQNFSRMICENGSFVFNGQTLTEAGVYTAELQSIYGCDSIVTLNLSVGAEYRDTLEAHVCYGGSYTQYNFNIENATETGYHEQHTSAQNGCDSTSVLHLIVHELNTTDLYATLCLGESYRLNGFNVTASKVGDTAYTRIVPTMYGCDSTVVLHLTVNPTSTVALTDAICAGNRYQANGFDTTFAEEGVYTLVNHDLNVFGCDSVTTMTLTVWPNLATEVSETICFNGSYNFHGTILTEAGDYADTLTTVHGCDSVVTLHLSIYPESVSEFAATACDSYAWNDSLYTTSGDYIQHFTNVNGCDSTVTLHLTVNYSNTSDTIAFACDSFDWYEHTNITESTETLTHTFTNASGCDSVVTLHLTVGHRNTGDTIAFACDSFDWYEHTNITESTETLTHTFTNASGCDSVVTLHLTVGHRNTGDTTVVACETFDWYEHSGITESCDNLVHTFANASGCDSVVTLHLTIHYGTHNVTETATCSAYTWNGETYDETGIYTYSYVNGDGCASTDTLHLTVNTASDVQYSATICQGETFSQYGFDTLMADAGTFTLVHEGQNVHGCDSTTTVTLTVFPTYSADTTVSICDVDVPYMWDDEQYWETGDYTISYQTVNHCDSIIHLHLNVNPTFSRDTAVTVCQGALPYFFDDEHSFEQAGNHTISLQTANGCDSIWHLTLTVTPNTELTTAVTICDSELPYTFMNESFSEAGTYDITESDDDHCLTITHFTLNVNATYHHYDTVVVCEETLPYTYGTTVLSQSGDYDIHFNAANSCDSLVSVHFTVIPTATGTEEQWVCTSDFPVSYGDETFTQEGVYTVTFHREGLCDSVVTFTLHQAQEYLVAETEEVCDHTLPYLWRGLELTQSGVYTDSLVSVHGCDSIFKLTLTVNPTVVVTDDPIVLCAGSSQIWRGMTLAEAGIYRDTVNSDAGCREIHEVSVTINPTYLFHDTVTVCSDELPYLWHGMSLTEAGTREDYHQTVNFCDSIYRLTLVVNPSYHATETASVCDYNLPYLWHGQSLTASGVYYDTLATTAGCDSTFALTFTVNPSSHTMQADTVCNTALPYSWRGRSLTAAGTYFDTIPNSFGCDDVFELQLTVNQADLTTLYDTICQGGQYTLNGFDTLAEQAGTLYAQLTLSNADGCDSIVNLVLAVMPTYLFETEATTCENVPYSWHGGEYSVEGTYYDSLTTAYGCDSVYVLHLTLNPTYEVYVNDTAMNGHEYTYDSYVFTPNDSGTVYHDIQYVTIAGCDSIVHLIIYVMYNDGVEEYSMTPEFAFFPNPTQARLSIRGERMRTVEVFNLAGKLVRRSDAETPEFTQVDVTNLSDGQYLVRVTLDDGQVVTGKIIVKRY